MQFVIGNSKNHEFTSMISFGKTFDYYIICLIGFVENPNFVKKNFV